MTVDLLDPYARDETSTLPDTPAIDGHVDLIYEMMRRRPSRPFGDLDDAPVTLEKMQRGNLRVLVHALYCPDGRNGSDNAATCLAELLEYAEKHIDEGGLNPIRSARELEACATGVGEPGGLMLLENADALVEFPLQRLIERAVGVVGLTHAGSNRLGDGNGVRNPQGLRKDGKNLIHALGDRGLAIDIAHLSDPCFWELMDLFQGPVISSHTGFRFFCNTPRNLAAESLKVLFERGGIVGISFNPDMLSLKASASIDDVFRHIDWVAERFGADHVAVGSDFCGFDGNCTGLEDASKLPALVRVLTDHGYPPDAVRKIMGENWYDFYSKLLNNLSR